MSFPPPADPSVDWSHLGLTINDLGNGHIESTYTVATGTWSAPQLVQDPLLRVHGLAPALNYGMQAYEGLKAYRSPDGPILLFRPDRHAARMVTSTAAVSIPAVPTAHFEQCVALAVACNAHIVPPAASGGCLYIRPLAFGIGGHLGLTPPAAFTFAVYVHPFGTYHGAAPLDALILDDFDRAAPRGTGNAKIGGNYAPVMRHTDAARVRGFPLTLHLDSATRSRIDEFSTSGFLGVREDATQPDAPPTLVLPASDSVIDSVTADSAAQLARHLGWNVERRVVPVEELPEFAEVLAAGTAASLVPVRSITREIDGRTDRVAYESTRRFQQLYDALRAIQAGRQEDPFGWCVPIQRPETYVPGGVTVVPAAAPPAATAPPPAAVSKNAVPAWALGAALVGAVSVLAMGMRR